MRRIWEPGSTSTANAVDRSGSVRASSFTRTSTNGDASDDAARRSRRAQAPASSRHRPSRRRG
jgi:hypothetical protein